MQSNFYKNWSVFTSANGGGGKGNGGDGEGEQNKFNLEHHGYSIQKRGGGQTSRY